MFVALVFGPPAFACEDLSGFGQVQSGYVVSSGVRVTNGPTLNAAGTCTLQNGVYLNVWGMAGIAGNREANEIDWKVGWNGERFSAYAAIFDVEPVSGFDDDIVAFGGAVRLTDSVTIAADYYAVNVPGAADGFAVGPTYSTPYGNFGFRAGVEEFSGEDLAVVKYSHEYELTDNVYIAGTLDWQLAGSNSDSLEAVIALGTRF